MTARKVAPARTLLDVDAEPVGGWWPEDVGQQPDCVEGPLHPRVGTVVRDVEDAASLATETIVQDGNCFMATRRKAVRYPWKSRRASGRMEGRQHSEIIGATILYVPLEEP